jgi:hypothetical protein
VARWFAGRGLDVDADGLAGRLLTDAGAR